MSDTSPAEKIMWSLFLVSLLILAFLPRILIERTVGNQFPLYAISTDAILSYKRDSNSICSRFIFVNKASGETQKRFFFVYFYTDSSPSIYETNKSGAESCVEYANRENITFVSSIGFSVQILIGKQLW
jgi:hypothetical protein